MKFLSSGSANQKAIVEQFKGRKATIVRELDAMVEEGLLIKARGEKNAWVYSITPEQLGPTNDEANEID